MSQDVMSCDHQWLMFQDLVSVATLTLTHPPLRLQFWEQVGGSPYQLVSPTLLPPSPQGLSAGVGVLLSSALSHFPFLTSPLSSLLLSLAGDEVSAGHVLHFMSSLTYFTEQLPNREIGRQVQSIVHVSGGVVSGCGQWGCTYVGSSGE